MNADLTTIWKFNIFLHIFSLLLYYYSIFSFVLTCFSRFCCDNKKQSKSKNTHVEGHIRENHRNKNLFKFIKFELIFLVK